MHERSDGPLKNLHFIFTQLLRLLSTNIFFVRSLEKNYLPKMTEIWYSRLLSLSPLCFCETYHLYLAFTVLNDLSLTKVLTHSTQCRWQASLCPHRSDKATLPAATRTMQSGPFKVLPRVLLNHGAGYRRARCNPQSDTISLVCIAPLSQIHDCLSIWQVLGMSSLFADSDERPSMNESIYQPQVSKRIGSA